MQHVYDRESLEGLALEASRAFKVAGYVAGLGGGDLIPDLNHPIHSRLGLATHFLVHVDFDAGGWRDVVIEFRDHGFCGIYVGPLYDIPPGKTRADVTPPACQFWKGFSMPREGYIDLLLAKTRNLVLNQP